MLRPNLLGSSKFKFDATTKVVVSGNSIYAGQNMSSFAVQLAARPEFALTNSAFVSTAVSGWTWRKLNGLDSGSRSALDAELVAPGKRVIMVVGEGTNAASSGARTGTQVIQDATDFIAASRVVNPNIYVVLCTAIPIGPAWTSSNIALNFSDASYIASPPTGVDRVVNMRGIPWAAHDGLTQSAFTDFVAKWEAGGTYVHPSQSGANDMLQMITSALLTIPDGAVPLST